MSVPGRGVTQIVLTGVATSVGVESTARAAYDHGYHVVLATDAMTDLTAEAHANSIERIFPRLGQTATSEEVLDLLGIRNRPLGVPVLAGPRCVPLQPA